MENSFDRIETLLALILIQNMKDSKQEEKTKTLNKAGFSNVEIAELLNTQPQVIANYLYKSKKKSKK